MAIAAKIMTKISKKRGIFFQTFFLWEKSKKESKRNI